MSCSKKLTILSGSDATGHHKKLCVWFLANTSLTCDVTHMARTCCNHISILVRMLERHVTYHLDHLPPFLSQPLILNETESHETKKLLVNIAE